MSAPEASRPRIAITMGDPGGVGPEIVARICHDPEVRALADLVVVGQRGLLDRGAICCGLEPPLVTVEEVGRPLVAEPGGFSARGGALAGACVERALELCLSGKTAAMTTGPISKEALRAAGYPDTGHTTMLARLTNTPKPVMMLAGARLKVVLATIHLPISQVPGSLTMEGIVEVGLITARSLASSFQRYEPRLAVAALNPHAGEGGLFGHEEAEIIAPAVRELKRQGIDATGPLSPDTVFWRAAQGHFDAVLAMYHDQGLIPLKLLHFDDAVNVTLGLPIIRTSVDHGTAYDIAGTGRANPASLKAAILMAALMAREAG